jgi:hypothetical protein
LFAVGDLEDWHKPRYIKQNSDSSGQIRQHQATTLTLDVFVHVHQFTNAATVGIGYIGQIQYYFCRMPSRHIKNCIAEFQQVRSQDKSAVVLAVICIVHLPKTIGSKRYSDRTKKCALSTQSRREIWSLILVCQKSGKHFINQKHLTRICILHFCIPIFDSAEQWRLNKLGNTMNCGVSLIQLWKNFADDV